MDKKIEKRGLRRGLSALMSDVGLDATGRNGAAVAMGSGFVLVPVQDIRANPDQPRKTFEAGALTELSASIKAKGIIQPLVVRRVEGVKGYEIVAGERRWRAAQMAQIHEVPVVIREFTDVEVIEIAIVENIQRSDLNAIEEATAFRQLIDRFGYTQEKLALSVSKSRSHVANTLRLLALPQDVQVLVSHGKLSAGHARALIGAPDALNMALKVIGGGLSVRSAEKLARTISTKPRRNPLEAGQIARLEKDADTRAIELDLTANLGMGVSIDHDPGVDGSGTLRVRYRTLDQLDMLCQVLSVIPRDVTR